MVCKAHQGGRVIDLTKFLIAEIVLLLVAVIMLTFKLSFQAREIENLSILLSATINVTSSLVKTYRQLNRKVAKLSNSSSNKPTTTANSTCASDPEISSVVADSSSL